MSLDPHAGLKVRTTFWRRQNPRRTMAKLIYSSIASLDGYVEDQHGRFDWAAPDDEVHTFVNERERPIGTYLYGRRMYETMVYWETAGISADDAAASHEEEIVTDRPGRLRAALEYAEIWRAADKIVYSRTLETVSSARTRLEHDFDPEAITRLKESSPADVTVGGAELAGQAMAAGLVDELHLILCPVVVGGGKAALPDGVRAQLELLEERRFTRGVVYLRYAVNG
jgi:dihydrofolate reductase